MASNSKVKTASERIPILARSAVSERAHKTLDLVRWPHQLGWNGQNTDSCRSSNSLRENAFPPISSIMHS